MSKTLKILFVPIDSIGHMSAAIGMAEVLIASGHTAVFAVNDLWRGRLAEYGIEEVLLTHHKRRTEEDPAKHWADLFFGGGAIKSGAPVETIINIRTKLTPTFAELLIKLDIKVDELLKDIKPDVVVLDQAVNIPSVLLSGIPWVLVCSFNPLFMIENEKTPPSGSGIKCKSNFYLRNNILIFDYRNTFLWTRN